MCQALRDIMEEDFRKVELRGEARGELKGVYKTLAELVKKKLITIAGAAAQAGVSESEFRKNTGLTTV